MNGLSKREIARRIAAVAAAGMTVASVRFGADGSMIVDTDVSRSQAATENDNGEAGYEAWKEGAARRPHRSQA